MITPTGAGARDDDGRAPARQLDEYLVDRLDDVDGRERRLHRVGDLVVERIAVSEHALEEALRSPDRADDVGQRNGPARARTTGICEMP